MSKVVGKLVFDIGNFEKNVEVNNSNVKISIVGIIYATGTLNKIGNITGTLDINNSKGYSYVNGNYSYYLPQGNICSLVLGDYPASFSESQEPKYNFVTPIINGTGDFLNCIGDTILIPKKNANSNDSVIITFYDKPNYPLV